MTAALGETGTHPETFRNYHCLKHNVHVIHETEFACDAGTKLKAEDAAPVHTRHSQEEGTRGAGGGAAGGDAVPEGTSPGR